MPLLQVATPPPQTELPEHYRGLLGRLKDPRDPRDYQVRSLFSVAPKRIKRQNSRMWMPPTRDRRYNQGRTSSCVEHGITHAIYGMPQPRHVLVAWEHFELYHRAQQIDEWPGEEPSYYGTSVRAGLAAAAETRIVTDPDPTMPGQVIQRPVNGVIESYHRVEDFEDLKDLMCSDDYHLGCSIVIGTDWGGDGMYQVDKQGFLDATHPDDGGHCWWLYFMNLRDNWCMGMNSWGTTPEESGMLLGGNFKLRIEGDDGLRHLWDRGADGWVIVQRNSTLSRLARKSGVISRTERRLYEQT